MAHCQRGQCGTAALLCLHSCSCLHGVMGEASQHVFKPRFNKVPHPRGILEWRLSTEGSATSQLAAVMGAVAMGRSHSHLIPIMYWDVDTSPVPHGHDGSYDNGEITQ